MDPEKIKFRKKLPLIYLIIGIFALVITSIYIIFILNEINPITLVILSIPLIFIIFSIHKYYFAVINLEINNKEIIITKRFNKETISISKLKNTKLVRGFNARSKKFSHYEEINFFTDKKRIKINLLNFSKKENDTFIKQFEKTKTKIIYKDIYADYNAEPGI